MWELGAERDGLSLTEPHSGQRGMNRRVVLWWLEWRSDRVKRWRNKIETKPGQPGKYGMGPVNFEELSNKAYRLSI